MTVGQGRVLVDQFTGGHDVCSHDGREFLRQALELGSQRTGKRALINLWWRFRFVVTSGQPRTDEVLLLTATFVPILAEGSPVSTVLKAVGSTITSSIPPLTTRAIVGATVVIAASRSAAIGTLTVTTPVSRTLTIAPGVTG
ncbi:hypothetical protein ACTQ49_12885 [Luteococcus sp. Sow4_B9]|uniref:hypothetical protein n=1 Tax=Luteococcus sp. Sow4_B9 TaxID=3438792 RepID=UPI003F95364F